MGGPWEDYQQDTPAMSLPGQGVAPTYPAQGGYQNSSDWNAIQADVVLNGGKGLSSIINQSPAHEGAREYQKGLAKEAAALDERRRAGGQVMSQLQALGDAANEMYGSDKNAFLGAIGPYNTTPYMDKLPVIGGMTVPKATAAYGGDGKAWNVQNRLQHMIHGLTTSFVASAGKGLNMSDSRQQAFEETMGAMMKATNKEEFDKITHDAADIIRKTFHLPEEKARAVVQNMGAQMQAEQGRLPGFSAAAAPMARPRAHNPKTGVTLEWNGSAWVRAN